MIQFLVLVVQSHFSKGDINKGKQQTNRKVPCYNAFKLPVAWVVGIPHQIFLTTISECFMKI